MSWEEVELTIRASLSLEPPTFSSRGLLMVPAAINMKTAVEEGDWRGPEDTEQGVALRLDIRFSDFGETRNAATHFEHFGQRAESEQEQDNIGMTFLSHHAGEHDY